MKRQEQVHVFIVRDASDALNLRNFLEWNAYDVSTVALNSESSSTSKEHCNTVHQIMDAGQEATVVNVQKSMQQMNNPPVISYPNPTKITRAASVSRARDTLKGNYESIIGDSPQVFEMLQKIEKFAKSAASVLITGETGTGKELIAHALHQNGSHPEREMVIVDCAALASNLIENELFGHERGAFTGANRQQIGLLESASGSTLFLDEIGELPFYLQSKLLRVLQEKEIRHLGGIKNISVDIRIVAATNRDLRQEVEAGRFRHDLYQRLKVLTIRVPPLRERRKDILALVNHFLAREGMPQEKPEKVSISPEVQTLFQDYAWPGNIRELEHTLIYAIHHVQGGVILPRHLPIEFHGADAIPGHSPEEGFDKEVHRTVSIPIGLTLKEIERRCILKTLTRMDGNRTKTAEILNINVRTLRNKLKTYAAS